MEDEPKQIPKVSPTPPGLGRTVQPTKSRWWGGTCARPRTRWHAVWISQEESMIFDQDGTTGQFFHLRR